jgi:hypothetical protein
MEKARGKDFKVFEEAKQGEGVETVDDHGRKVPLPGANAARYGG